jgi:predicted acylesterase/phospholipase RssA
MTNDDLRHVETEQVEQNTLPEDSNQQQDTGSLMDVPLHCRFRFWLPLLSTLSILALIYMLPAVFIPTTVEPESFTFPNFTVSELNRTLRTFGSSLSTTICSMAVFLGFWYVVGRGLDSLRLDRTSRSRVVPGWTWALAFVSFVELVRDTATIPDPSIFYYLAAFGISIQSLPPLVRLNYWIVSWGAPLAWTSAWVLVLVHLGRFIRAQTNVLPVAAGAPVNNNRQIGNIAKFLPGISWSRLAMLVSAIVLLPGMVFLSAHSHIDPDRRRLLIAVPALLLAFVYIKWLFPQFHFLGYLRKQLRWRKLLVHLLFLAVLILLMWGSVVALDRVDRYADHWSASLGHYRLATFLIAMLKIVAPIIPMLLAGLAFIFLYRIPFRKARRHILFAAVFTTGFSELSGSVETSARLALFTIFYFKWLFPDFRLQLVSEKVRLWFSARKPAHYVAAGIVLVLLSCVFVQNREIFVTVLVDGTLLLVLRLIVPKSSRYRWIFYGGVLAVTALVIVGSYNPERDLILAMVGFAGSYGFWLFAERQGWKRRQRMSAVFLVTSVWVWCSVGDAMPPDLTFASSYAMLLREYRPERFVALKQQYPGKRIGLALSGGGYRAALMHAGVLQGLEDSRIPVTNISSVSGGSITGAYYALGGTPQGVLNAILYRQFNTKRDVFDFQNVLRMLFSAPLPGTHIRLAPGYLFGRSDVQAQALDRVLLHDRTFKDLPADGPRLMICVTDLNSGSALGLTTHWRMSRFLIHPPGEDIFPNVRALYGNQPRVALASNFAALNSRDTRLSKAVAASGAFPLAFEPVPLSGQHAESFLMADGGVSDNSGMTLLLEADRRASLHNPEKGDGDWALDVAVSVDGGAMFHQDHADEDQTSLDVAGRAVDLIHSRLGVVKPPEPRGPGSSAGPALVLLSPSIYMDNSRNYDYRHIGMYFMGLAEPRWFWQHDSPPLATQQFSVEQQQVLSLIAAQATEMDHDSFRLLANLEGVHREYYADLLKRLDAATLTQEETRVLEEGHADHAQLDTINNKRRRRIDALLGISLHLAADFSQCLRVFVSTQTLDDQFNSYDSQRLYRLGQYLALLNGPQIRASLGTETSGDPNAAITPAEKAMVRCLVESTGKHAQDSRKEYQKRRQAANADLDSCLQQFVSQNPSLSTDVESIRVSF